MLTLGTKLTLEVLASSERWRYLSQYWTWMFGELCKSQKKLILKKLSSQELVLKVPKKKPSVNSFDLILGAFNCLESRNSWVTWESTAGHWDGWGQSWGPHPQAWVQVQEHQGVQEWTGKVPTLCFNYLRLNIKFLFNE